MRKLGKPIQPERPVGIRPAVRILLPSELPASRFVLLLALTDLVLHLAASGGYGFFRDELYYIACGRHLAFGYVDQPPLVALVARLSSLAFGNTLPGFRVFPALALSGLVLLTGCLTRELGGGRFAQALAALGVFLAPVYLAFGSFLSMNAFEPLFWTGCTYILVQILKRGNERLWLLLGGLAGIGLQNKHTMLVFGFGMISGMILARDWKQMRNKWFWFGGLLALIIFLPNVIWEAQHGWPQIEVVRNCQRLKNTPVSLWRFFGEQILFVNPVAFPVVASGLVWLLLSRRGQRFRSLGWAFVVIVAVIMVLDGKTYYPLPFYPILFAAGGIGLGWLLSKSRGWLRGSYLAALVVSGLLMLPFGVPILSLEALLRYQQVIRLESAVKTEHDSRGDLHQLYADMIGWENMAATVATVYDSLSPSDRGRCGILAGNYGEAGAIDFFGPQYGLPDAISGHNNYYLWGTHGYTGEVAIVFGQHAESIKAMFGSVERVATISNRHAAQAETQLPVYLCRRSKAPLAQLWPQLRYFE
jgi:hypothetical protein